MKTPKPKPTTALRGGGLVADGGAVIWNGRRFAWKAAGFYRESTHGGRPLHFVIWESAHGQAIPAEHLVLFLDGDKNNFEIPNLELVAKSRMSSRLAELGRAAGRPLEMKCYCGDPALIGADGRPFKSMGSAVCARCHKLENVGHGKDAFAMQETARLRPGDIVEPYIIHGAAAAKLRHWNYF